MIESAAVKDQIREYVIEEFAKTKGINQVTDQEVLTKNGIIDSMGIFRLVGFLEETFNVRIGDEEVVDASRPATDELAEWADAYRAAIGEPLSFIHADVAWSGLAMRNLGKTKDLAVGPLLVFL